MSGYTAIEKIVSKSQASGVIIRAGSFIDVCPKHVMTHDNSSAVIAKFEDLGFSSIADPKQPVIAIDHDIQNYTPENLGKYAKIQAFAKQHGLMYYPPGRGIAHQIMIEEGFVKPGTVVVGSDSHSNMYGALAALGTPIVRTDAASVWATGKFWWRVPRQVRVSLTGKLPEGATGKDVILTLCRIFCSGEVLNAAVEFAGDGIESLSVDDRITIANMSTEWGALAALFPFDHRLRSWLNNRPDIFPRDEVRDLWDEHHSLMSDPDAHFETELELDLGSICPHVTGPNSVWRSRPAVELESEIVAIDKAYLMSCVNGRLSDLQAAGKILGKERPVAKGVELYIAAASHLVEQQARSDGTWQRLLDAGAIPLPSGCGACIGLGAGTLEPGEVGISATNRNYEGRMGASDAACYLASPEVVAESAARGVIAAPSGAKAAKPRYSCRHHQQESNDSGTIRLIEGFPRSLRAHTIVLTRDNIDTDGIYGKDVTYRDDITLADQGRHVLLNYDSAFHERDVDGAILVAGRNFGSGSSREQAATALRSAGIAAVIAHSISATYQRNAFNNGLIVIESAEVSSMLLETVGVQQRTVSGPRVQIDFEASEITLGDRRVFFSPLSTVAQRLIVAGGLENELRSKALQSRSHATGVMV